MKKILFLSAFLLLSFHSFTQVSLEMFFPYGVTRSLFYDTILTPRVLLERVGIQSITVHQNTIRNGTNSYERIEYDLTKGRIDARRWYVSRLKYKDTIYMHMDSVLYDAKGRMSGYWTGRSGEVYVFQKSTIDYPAEGKAIQTWVSIDNQRAMVDTNIYYCTYNAKGQLIRQEHEVKGPKAAKSSDYRSSASIYYNADGLPDSILHDSLKWGTFVFKRTQKRKTKVIEMETAFAHRIWVYNASGQCISSGWTSKNYTTNQNGSKEKAFTKVKYYYNKDGTVSKVAEDAGYRKTISLFTYGK